MRALLHEVASRLTGEVDKEQSVSSAERRMLRREQDRAYWADWQSNPSQLAEIHAMYAREAVATHH